MPANWEGYLGTALVIVAYVPQLVRLVKAHCSTGVSVVAYALWTGSSVLLLIHAIQISSPVFIVLQAYQVIVTLLIVVLGERYAGCGCAQHGDGAVGS